MHRHRGNPFGREPIEHPGGALGLARQYHLRQLEHMKPRHVEHRALDLFVRQLTRRVQQRELLHLLVRGQQVAFDPVRKELQRALPGLAGRHPLLLAREALRDPTR